MSEFDLYKLPNSDERPPWISFYRITDQRTSRTEGARRELHTRYVRAVDAVHVESVELDSTRTDGTKTTKKLEEITVRYIYTDVRL